MGILWEDDAWQEYLDWQTQDKKTLRRINKLIKDIQRTPFDGIGHPEPLSGNLSGWWSRHTPIISFTELSTWINTQIAPLIFVYFIQLPFLFTSH